MNHRIIVTLFDLFNDRGWSITLCNWKFRKSCIVLSSRLYPAHCLYGTDDMREMLCPHRSLCLLGFKSGTSWNTDWRITDDLKSGLCIQIMDVARLEVFVAVCMNITVFVRSDAVLYRWEVFSAQAHVAQTLPPILCRRLRHQLSLNTFAASYLNTQGLNNSCLKSPASTLVDLTFQSRALRSFSLNQLRNLSL